MNANIKSLLRACVCVSRCGSYVAFEEQRILVILDPKREERHDTDHQQGPHPSGPPGSRPRTPMFILRRTPALIRACSFIHVCCHPQPSLGLFGRGHGPRTVDNKHCLLDVFKSQRLFCRPVSERCAPFPAVTPSGNNRERLASSTDSCPHIQYVTVWMWLRCIKAASTTREETGCRLLLFKIKAPNLSLSFDCKFWKTLILKATTGGSICISYGTAVAFKGPVTGFMAGMPANIRKLHVCLPNGAIYRIFVTSCVVEGNPVFLALCFSAVAQFYIHFWGDSAT